MQYKPAFMIIGDEERFIGNYDNLADLRSEYSTEYWDCWDDGQKLIIRYLSSKEIADKKDEQKRSSFFYFMASMIAKNRKEVFL